MGIIKGIKRSKVDLLLNKQPNPFQDINTFKRNLVTDYLLDGNMFIYYDGAHLYHIPADTVTIHGDSKTYIEKYTYKFKSKRLRPRNSCLLRKAKRLSKKCKNKLKPSRHSELQKRKEMKKKFLDSKQFLIKKQMKQ